MTNHYFYAQNLSVKNRENNSVLAGVPFLSPSRAQIPISPSPFNAGHAGYFSASISPNVSVKASTSALHNTVSPSLGLDSPQASTGHSAFTSTNLLLSVLASTSASVSARTSPYCLGHHITHCLVFSLSFLHS